MYVSRFQNKNGYMYTTTNTDLCIAYKCVRMGLNQANGSGCQELTESWMKQLAESMIRQFSTETGQFMPWKD